MIKIYTEEMIMINTDQCKTRYIINGHHDVTFEVVNKLPLKSEYANFFEIKVVTVK